MGTLKFKWNSELDPFYTVPEDATEYTLHTNKKMMKDSLVIINDGVQSYTINYANFTTGERADSEILLGTAKKMMVDNISGSINNIQVDNFITFSSSASFSIGGINNLWGFSLSTGVQYKTPAREWTTYHPTLSGSNYLWGGTITAAKDSNTELFSISFRATGYNNKIVCTSNVGLFPITKATNQKIDISGNLASLIDYQLVESGTKPDVAVKAFKFALYNSKITSAESLVFPDTINDSCYESMFGHCSQLTKPPQKLPAKELKQSCYYRMFDNCTSLTTPPQLPATTLAQKCYCQMFYGCSLLNKLVSLPVRTLETECYSGMFQGCKLILIADLPEPTVDYPTSYRIPSSVTGTAASDALTNMFTSTGGPFKGTPLINTTYYTSNEIITA